MGGRLSGEHCTANITEHALCPKEENKDKHMLTCAGAAGKNRTKEKEKEKRFHRDVEQLITNCKCKV